ncbi:alpha/beta hydrolase fold protein [Xylariales sp. AK1849]|nr:alpha/beta hydrolase fold protein [Xylariales sp. AK1849]
MSVQPQYPLLSRLYNGVTISTIKGVTTPVRWYQNWHSWFYPTECAPNIVKTYECRSYLPIRIFFPKAYDQTSPENLPLIFSIHGGGWCVGDPLDDDEWNRHFADEYGFLVVALNYSKAPFRPFPTAIHDLEALMLAVIADESLPFDKKRVAITGFSAGGNLALSVCQLPSIREKINISAALPVYPPLDQSISADERIKRRYFKTELGSDLRGSPADYLKAMSPIFKWSYINHGQDLRDPLLSPLFAARDALPQNIYIVAAELDQLAHEAWRMACKLSGRPEPTPDNKVGQAEVAMVSGGLILNDDRFAFQHESPDGASVRWLLVPDQVHGFDRLPERFQGSEKSVRDAQLKTKQYQKLFGEWLHQVVWKDSTSASD